MPVGELLLWNAFAQVKIFIFFLIINLILSFFQVTNVAETLGLGKKTPMGIFLDEFGIEPEVKYM